MKPVADPATTSAVPEVKDVPTAPPSPFEAAPAVPPEAEVKGRPRMAPANPRLHTDLRASGENVLRLIDDLQLLAAERKPQLLSRPCAAATGPCPALLEEAHAPTAIGLGAGKRDVGVPRSSNLLPPSLGGSAMRILGVHTNALSAYE